MLTAASIRTCLACLSLLCWVGFGWVRSAQAQPQPQPQITGARVALVIGNSDYRAVASLPNAGNDARLIAATLRGLGFTLIGGGAQLDLDRAHLTQAIDAFGRSLSGSAVALFYYSGHGLQVQGVNWLVPVDANPTRPNDLDFQMVDADLVLRQMDGSGTRLNIVLLDACRNNPFAVTGLRSVQGGLAEMRAPEGTLISYATQPGNVAVDGAGANSPYTTALAAAMRQPGTDIFRMFNQVGLQVKRTTGGSQQPWVSTSPIDGDFYFAGLASAPVPPAPARPAPGPAVATPVAPAPSLPASAPPVVAPAEPAPRLAGLAPRPVTPAPPASPVLSPPSSTAAPSPAPAGSTPPPSVSPNPAAAPDRAASASVTPAPVTPAPVMPAPVDPVDAIRAMADAQRCSILDTRSSGSQVEIRGLALPGSPWTGFTRQVAQTRGVRLVANEIDLLPSFGCQVVDAIGPAIRATRARSGGRMLVPARSELTSGSAIVVTLREASGDTARLDLFRGDGMVEHLAPARAVRQGRDLQVSLATSSKAPAGRQLLAAIIGLPADILGSRPSVEPAGIYLAALREALAADTVTQVDIAPLLVQASVIRNDAAPARSAATSPRAPRCANILERAQLGEILSDSDRTLLRTSCQ